MTAVPNDARDLVARAEELDDVGTDRLRELRAQQAALAAQQAQERAAIDDQLQAAERRFAAIEAQKRHEEQHRAARAAYTAAGDRYRDLADPVARMHDDILTKQAELVEQVLTYLVANREVEAAGANLKHAADQLRRFETVGVPHVEDHRAGVIMRDNPLIFAANFARAVAPRDLRLNGTRIVQL